MIFTRTNELLLKQTFKTDVVEAFAGQAAAFTVPVSWWYKIWAIGAGGGGGGGSYKSGHKRSGSSGGGGSGFIGSVFLTAGTYRYSCGIAGTGGSNGRTAGDGGHDGKPTYIQNSSGINIVYAGGGNGGAGARANGRSAEGSAGQVGGVLTIAQGIQTKDVSLQRNGNNGVYNGNPGGASLYNSYGRGGNVVYKGSGYAGTGGYLRIILNPLQ